MLLNRALVKKDCADFLETFKGEAIFPKPNSLIKTPSPLHNMGKKGQEPQFVKLREIQIYCQLVYTRNI